MDQLNTVLIMSSSPVHVVGATARPVPGYGRVQEIDWRVPEIVDRQCFECASCGLSIEPSSEIYLANDKKFCSQLCRSMTVHKQQSKAPQQSESAPRIG